MLTDEEFLIRRVILIDKSEKKLRVGYDVKTLSRSNTQVVFRAKVQQGIIGSQSISLDSEG